MSIFDKLKKGAAEAVQNAAKGAANAFGKKEETFTFQALPESLAEMQALSEASLDTPFKTAALTVCALCVYAADKDIGTEMLNWLRGPVLSATTRSLSSTTVSAMAIPMFLSPILREQSPKMIIHPTNPLHLLSLRTPIPTTTKDT